MDTLEVPKNFTSEILSSYEEENYLDRDSVIILKNLDFFRQRRIKKVLDKTLIAIKDMLVHKDYVLKTTHEALKCVETLLRPIIANSTELGDGLALAYNIVDSALGTLYEKAERHEELYEYFKYFDEMELSDMMDLTHQGHHKGESLKLHQLEAIKKITNDNLMSQKAVNQQMALVTLENQPQQNQALYAEKCFKEPQFIILSEHEKQKFILKMKQLLPGEIIRKIYERTKSPGLEEYKKCAYSVAAIPPQERRKTRLEWRNSGLYNYVIATTNSHPEAVSKYFEYGFLKEFKINPKYNPHLSCMPDCIKNLSGEYPYPLYAKAFYSGPEWEDEIGGRFYPTYCIILLSKSRHENKQSSQVYQRDAEESSAFDIKKARANGFSWLLYTVNGWIREKGDKCVAETPRILILSEECTLSTNKIKYWKSMLLDNTIDASDDVRILFCQAAHMSVKTGACIYCEEHANKNRVISVMR